MGQWDINGELEYNEAFNLAVNAHHYTGAEDQTVGVMQDDAISISAVFYPKLEDLEWLFLGPRVEMQRLRVSFSEQQPMSTYARVLGVDANSWSSDIERVNVGAVIGWRLQSDEVWTVSLSGEVTSTVSENIKPVEISDEFESSDQQERSVDRFTKQFSLRVGLAIH